MRKKFLAVLLVLAMIATVFAGCSSKDSGRNDREDREESRDEDDEDDDDADIDLESVLDKLLGRDDDDRDDDDDFFFGNQDPQKEEKVINVMSFTDEVPNMVQKYLDMHPELGYTMRTTIVSTMYGEYQPTLDEMLKAGGKDAPDIYAMETAFVYKYTQGDAAFFAASYDDLGIQTDRMIRESKTAPYAVEVGTRPDDGEVVALPYQGTGGCFIYRRSIAEEVWGTDDPAVVQMKIGGGSGNWDRFWVAAEELKAHGFGIVSGDGDVWHALENSADEAWIVDGQLTLDPKREALLDVSKKLKDNNYHNETHDWQDEWFWDMKGIGEKEVLGFFGPAWLINYTMADNCGDTYGDWAVCNSPVGFYWGGTWVAANRDVVDMKKRDVVADIIQWITLDYDENSLQYMWANGIYQGYNGTKDTVVSGTVMEKSDGSIDFLGGQNMFDYFVPANEYARGDNLSQYDELINSAWRNAVRDYVAGWVDRDGAIAQFADEVRNKLGVTVSDDFYYNGSDSGYGADYDYNYDYDYDFGYDYDYDYDFGYDYDWGWGAVAIPTPTPTRIPDRDLRGVEIIIGDWYSAEGEEVPKNAQDEATLKYRQEIFAKYNFTADQRAVAGWSSMEDTVVNSTVACAPAAHVFELDYDFVSKPMSYGLFYDLATLDEFDFSEDKWNDSVRKLMTRGNSIYGMSAEANEPGGGVFWNKRLFEEAGIDPELPYDLQASGEWTWSKFEELCSKLTRDDNGDGVTDVFATVSNGVDMIRGLVASTGEDFFLKDEKGILYNNMDSENVLDAMNFAASLYAKGYEMPQPEGSNWEYYQGAFQSGKAAMTFTELYMCEPEQIYGDSMRDEIGFVMPPKPDGAEKYHSYLNNNIYVIPACYDAETAGDIAFAFNAYTMATPGYDDPSDWLEKYYAYFAEERAVDETIAMFGYEEFVSCPLEILLSGGTKLNEDLLWRYPFTTVTPAEQVAAISDSWAEILAQANANY